MEYRILGPVEVLDGDRVVALPRAKPRALLAALLLRAGETVSREQLIDALWGDDPPESAPNALQVYVSQLRKALGAETIERRATGYVLDVPREQVDLARFEDLVDSARGAEPALASERLRAALALWRGTPEADAARLEELRLGAIESAIDAELELGLHTELIPELQALVSAEPLRERPRAQLMFALYRAGRQAEALAEFARARALLVEELGVEPGSELQRAQHAILAQDEQAAAPPPVRRVSLPTPATPLVGRTAELEEVAALLDAGARLVTLTGPGGIGKTRLALEAARAADDDATFVPLGALDVPALVPSAIARALHLENEDLVEHLRGRTTLLLLDNFEQVIDAAPFVATLLADAPGVRLLVTSRSVLRVSGEHEYEVPPLGAAVELFLARATGDVDDLDAVAAICERLDGLPLAIELAAARTKLLPPPALLARLESRLELLTAGPRDAPERQRTMRAAIDWSYRLLEPEEQVLFARLAVFAGGATVELIETVCDGDLDRLSSLVEKSLVRTRDTRVWMLETLREYAAEQLRALGEEESLRDRHLEAFAELVAHAEPQLDTPKQQEWFERLEIELPNLRSALGWAIERGDAESAVAIAGRLQRLWQVHGHLDEGARWLEAALASGACSPLAAARAWNGLGIVRGDRGDYDGAADAFSRAGELGREAGDLQRVSASLGNLGAIASFRGDYEAAQAAYEEALEIRRSQPGTLDSLPLLENIGCLALLRGDVETSRAAFEEALELGRARGDLKSIGSSTRWLARALIAAGELERSRSLLEESLRLAEQIGHQQGIACALDFSAAWAAAAGEPDEAARLLAEGEAMWASVGAVRPADVALLSPAGE
jgi:predicted ATPase/DNA-binding SARP family transcriptional activator